MTGKSRKTCKFIDKQKYNLVVHVSGTEDRRRMKILDTDHFETALAEMIKFRQELKTTGFHRAEGRRTEQKTTLKEFIKEYLDACSNEHHLAHLNRPVGNEHLRAIRNCLTHFSESFIKAGYKYDILEMREIGDNEIQLYNKYWHVTLGRSGLQYKKQLVLLKTFFNWVIRAKRQQIFNPFLAAKLTFKRNKTLRMVSSDEFNRLIEATVPEKGEKFDKKGINRYVYRNYLIPAFKIALETGLRREEIALLKWNNLFDIEDGVLVLNIDNLKVNKLMDVDYNENHKEYGKGQGNYKKPVPVTKGLKDVLIELGLYEKKGSNDYIISRPSDVSTKQFSDCISRGFTHYIKDINSALKFSDLRKTYITHLTKKLKGNAKLFTGHSNEKIMMDHYVVGGFIAGDLDNFSVLKSKSSQESDEELDMNESDKSD
jgi:integrase